MVQPLCFACDRALQAVSVKNAVTGPASVDIQVQGVQSVQLQHWSTWDRPSVLRIASQDYDQSQPVRDVNMSSWGTVLLSLDKICMADSEIDWMLEQA